MLQTESVIFTEVNSGPLKHLCLLIKVWNLKLGVSSQELLISTLHAVDSALNECLGLLDHGDSLVVGEIRLQTSVSVYLIIELWIGDIEVCFFYET